MTIGAVPETAALTPLRLSAHMETAHLSKQAYERLQGELEERSGPSRKSISAAIERAREHGDIKENGEYHAAKNEQGLNEARIRQLEQMLKTAVVVESTDGEVVAPGTIVEIRMDGDDEATSYLVGSIEERHADPRRALHVVTARPGVARPRARRHRQLRRTARAPSRSRS